MTVLTKVSCKYVPLNAKKVTNTADFAAVSEFIVTSLLMLKEERHNKD